MVSSLELVQTPTLLKAVLSVTEWMLGAFKLEGKLHDSAVAFYLGSTSAEVRERAAEILTYHPPLVISQQPPRHLPLLFDEKLGLLQSPQLQVSNQNKLSHSSLSNQ